MMSGLHGGQTERFSPICLFVEHIKSQGINSDRVSADWRLHVHMRAAELHGVLVFVVFEARTFNMHDICLQIYGSEPAAVN